MSPIAQVGYPIGVPLFSFAVLQGWHSLAEYLLQHYAHLVDVNACVPTRKALEQDQAIIVPCCYRQMLQYAGQTPLSVALRRKDDATRKILVKANARVLPVPSAQSPSVPCLSMVSTPLNQRADMFTEHVSIARAVYK